MAVTIRTEEQWQARYLKTIENYRPIDDEFSRFLFRNNLPLAQEVLRIITGINDLKLIQEKTREDLKRLSGCCKKADEMYTELLAERTRYFKETPKGVSELSNEIKELRDEAMAEGREEGKLDVAHNMLRLGTMSFEDIAAVTGFTIERIKQLAAQNNPANA